MLDVDRHVLLGPGPLGVGARLPREAGLVEVDHAVAVVLGLGELPLHVAEPRLQLLWVLLLCRFAPPVLFFLDSVERVDLLQQRRIELGVRELFEKVLASVDKRERGLAFEGRRAGDPLDLVLLEEAQAPALTWLDQLHRLESR